MPPVLDQPKSKHMGFRVTPKLRKVIERCAKDYRASMSDVMLRFVIDRLLAEGYLQEETNGRRNTGNAQVVAHPQG